MSEFPPRLPEQTIFYPVTTEAHREYWIPAGDLSVFNRNIVGTIAVVRSFPE